MKLICVLKKSAFIVAVCMAVLCASGCSESSKPTPEQIAERTNLLYHAVRNDDLEMVKACIEAGARVNAVYLTSDRTENALITAVKRKRTDIAELLIKSGADVNAKTVYGETALMYAEGHDDIVELLRAAGAEE